MPVYLRSPLLAANSVISSWKNLLEESGRCKDADVGTMFMHWVAQIGPDGEERQLRWPGSLGKGHHSGSLGLDWSR